MTRKKRFASNPVWPGTCARPSTVHIASSKSPHCGMCLQCNARLIVYVVPLQIFSVPTFPHAADSLTYWDVSHPWFLLFPEASIFFRCISSFPEVGEVFSFTWLGGVRRPTSSRWRTLDGTQCFRPPMKPFSNINFWNFTQFYRYDT